MRADLRGPVDLWEFALFAELATWQKRPELQALCAAARRSGNLSDDEIDEVLPGLSPRARSNLGRHIQFLQLIDSQGTLTTQGERCASTGEAPAMEQGAYELLVASHPLFGCYVLDFKRTAVDGFDRKFDDLEPLPRWLVPDHGRVYTSVFEGSTRFSIAAFPSPKGSDAVGRTWELAPAKLHWEIDLVTGANEWTLEGTVGTGDHAREFRSEPESVSPADLVGLFGKWEPRWDAKTGRVAISYDGKADSSGRESFVREFVYPQVSIGKFGEFHDVGVHDVPVGPATDDDARTWATAIVVARTEAAGAYVAPEKWRSDWADAVVGTPLAGRAGSAPDPVRLVMTEGQRLPARTKWLMVAGVDLAMGA
jgi:hypothetical protein